AAHPDFAKGGKVDSSKFLNAGCSNSKSLFTTKKWTKATNKNAFSKCHPVQKQFVQDLLDCIAIDMLPLDFIERPTFIKLVRNLNRSIRLVSARTLGRRFVDAYSEFKQRMKGTVKNVDDNTFHIILDMWTDRQKSSMIGFRSQFITPTWKLHNSTLAFRHFKEQHSGRDIRRMVDSV
ncbi:unnamed protein product, partial [Allacma fusca]